MISKYAFMKPELTFYHLENVLQLLQDHYFSIQQLPVLHFMRLFSELVLGDQILEEVSALRQARLLMNLGLKSNADEAAASIAGKAYVLNDEERKVNFEKIKALRDPNDDLKSKQIAFRPVEEDAPLVLEQRRIHESWLLLAEEHIRWGNYVKAKSLLTEVNLHARILKDQPNYAKSLLSLSTIAYLEGESGSALKLDMMCHSYAQDMEFVQQAVVHTYDLLMEFDKLEECSTLLDGTLDMLDGIRETLGTVKQQGEGNKKSLTSLNPVVQNNLPLEFAQATCYLLKATLHIKEMQLLKTIDEQEPVLVKSFDCIDKFEAQLQ